MPLSKTQNKINIQSIKETINPDNNKIWWNTRDGYIVKTTYNEVNNQFLIEIYQKQLKLLKKLGKVKEAYRESINETKNGNQDLFVSRYSQCYFYQGRVL